MRHRTTPADVEAVLGRYPNAPGAATLRRVLRGDVHARSASSRAASSDYCGRPGYRCPRPTARPAAGASTAAGPHYHHSCHAREQDRRREREARARGDEFRRYSYGDVLEHPRLMLNELRDLLPPGP